MKTKTELEIEKYEIRINILKKTMELEDLQKEITRLKSKIKSIDLDIKQASSVRI
jgi:predicted  nucleic acid-binding Zn-ribbon protein